MSTTNNITPSSNTLSRYVQAHLGAVQAENSDLTSQNEGLMRAIVESRDQRTLFEENSSLTRFVLYVNATSIFFSIALYFGPGALFMIAHQIISIGCLTATACAFYNFWTIEQFDPYLNGNRKTLLIQIITLSFLVFEVWWASNDLLTKSEAFRPTVLRAFFLWGCVNSTLIAIVAQHVHQSNNVILRSGNIYDDVQDSLMQFFEPLRMLVSLLFRRFMPILLQASHALFNNPTAI